MEACNIEVGEWRLLDEPIPVCRDSRRKDLRRDCSRRSMMQFQPRDCELPPLTKESLTAALGKRKLRFIGDSVMWDHFQYIGRCLMDCSERLDHNARYHRLTLKEERFRKEWRGEKAVAIETRRQTTLSPSCGLPTPRSTSLRVATPGSATSIYARSTTCRTRKHGTTTS
jgi:hypothetical protein